MVAPVMTPPSQPATLSFNPSTTVAGDGGYSKVGTIEGWIQILSCGKPSGSHPIVLFEDPQRLLTLTGIKLTGEKDEFWVEFSSASGKFLFSGGGEVEVSIADLQFHHFALTLDRDEGLSIGFDGNDPKTIITNAADKIKADLLIEQLTIGHAKEHSGKEHPGFIGKIAGLHLWKKKLAPAEIRAAGNWHGSYCPTPDFGFNHGVRPYVGNPPNDAPAELLGFLNPEIPSFTFYYEPKGYWAMDGTQTDKPHQADLPHYDQNHHAVYDSPRYFLTTREKTTNKLYIISDNSDKKPLCLAWDQSRRFVFTTDDLILTFSAELTNISPDGQPVHEALVESFSFASKPGKALPDEFCPVLHYESKCVRPTVLQEDMGLVQKWGDMFAKTPYNLDPSLLGWNEVNMKNPFNSTGTGADNFIFGRPPSGSKRYFKALNSAVPFGFKAKLSSFAEGTMHSTLISNGSDLRTAATKTSSIKGDAEGGCAFFSASVSFHSNFELGKIEEHMYNNETMHSQHTFLATTYTLVLDKPNVRFSGYEDLTGFWRDIHKYARSEIKGVEIFDSYGTHYPHAICFGARGTARNTYTKETMSALLQNCKKVGWGAEAKASAKIAGFKGGVGGAYSQTDANDDSDKVSKTQHTEHSIYKCIGSSSCNSSGVAHPADDTAVPVLLDLRPITELLAPPFFDTYEMTVDVRSRLTIDLMAYLSRKEPPRTVDVFHFLSLTFSRPRGFYQDDPDYHPEDLREATPGAGLFTCSSAVSVKVTGSSNTGPGTLLQLQNFSIENSLKQAFWFSGNKTDHQVCVEFTLPNTWSYGPQGRAFYPDAPSQDGKSLPNYPPRTMKLEFDLDAEGLSREGINGTFVLPTTNVVLMGETPYWDDGKGGPQLPLHPFVIKFPVVLRKLNLQDAFFNGLPAEWKKDMEGLGHAAA